MPEQADLIESEVARDSGQDTPRSSDIATPRAQYPEWSRWFRAVVAINLAAFDDTADRVNVSLPRRVLHRLEALARDAKQTPSGFKARMAIVR